MARAERFTINNATPEYYSDFTCNFDKNPVTNKLAKLTNVEAVKQGIKLAVLTGLGERPYQPALGSKTRSTLFSLHGEEDLIRDTIENCVKNHCRRVALHAVQLNDDGDYGYEVNIVFSIINIPNQVFNVNISLKRLR